MDDEDDPDDDEDASDEGLDDDPDDEDDPDDDEDASDEGLDDDPDDDEDASDEGLDDDLDDAQRLVWRGYAPVYHRAPEILPWYERPVPDFRDLLRPGWDRAPEPHPQVPPYERFRCDHCHRSFYSPIDDADAEDEYWHTFGVHAPLEERLTLCEGCYDKAMAGLLAEPGARN